MCWWSPQVYSVHCINKSAWISHTGTESQCEHFMFFTLMMTMIMMTTMLFSIFIFCFHPSTRKTKSSSSTPSLSAMFGHSLSMLCHRYYCECYGLAFFSLLFSFHFVFLTCIARHTTATTFTVWERAGWWIVVENIQIHAMRTTKRDFLCWQYSARALEMATQTVRDVIRRNNNEDEKREKKHTNNSTHRPTESIWTVFVYMASDIWKLKGSRQQHVNTEWRREQQQQQFVAIETERKGKKSTTQTSNVLDGVVWENVHGY